MAVKTNIQVDQGADFVYNIFLIDLDGNPVDLTGYTGQAQIRRTFTSSTYYNMNVSFTANSGVVTLSMNAATTSLLSSPRYVYDVELTRDIPPYVRSRIVEGIVTVNPEVTR